MHDYWNNQIFSFIAAVVVTKKYLIEEDFGMNLYVNQGLRKMGLKKEAAFIVVKVEEEVAMKQVL